MIGSRQCSVNYNKSNSVKLSYLCILNNIWWSGKQNIIHPITIKLEKIIQSFTYTWLNVYWSAKYVGCSILNIWNIIHGLHFCFDSFSPVFIRFLQDRIRKAKYSLILLFRKYIILIASYYTIILLYSKLHRSNRMLTSKWIFVLIL